MNRTACIVVLVLSLTWIGSVVPAPAPDAAICGDLIVFHAGSLAGPLREISAAFNREHPDVRILREAAGSLDCARKISELHKPCDVFLSADYSVIDTLLIPKFASWNLKFAGTEMVIAYRDESRQAHEINRANWRQVLLRRDVAVGRSDPDADPCGYRTVLTMELGEKYYHDTGLAERLLSKPATVIRPKSVDLLALLEAGQIDYVFEYRSVARQHHLKFISLPDEINLKNPKFMAWYKGVSVQVNGLRPGQRIARTGEPIEYGLTIPRNPPNPQAALAFVRFLLTGDKGRAILERQGLTVAVPSSTVTLDKIPQSLRPFVRAEVVK